MLLHIFTSKQYTLSVVHIGLFSTGNMPDLSHLVSVELFSWQIYSEMETPEVCAAQTGVTGLRIRVETPYYLPAQRTYPSSHFHLCWLHPSTPGLLNALYPPLSRSSV